MDRTPSRSVQAGHTQQQDTATSPMDVSVSATMRCFQRHPETLQAKLLVYAAQLEHKEKGEKKQSPQRKLFMSDLAHIRELSSQLQNPDIEKDLGELAALQYLNQSTQKRSILTMTPRTLSTEGCILPTNIRPTDASEDVILAQILPTGVPPIIGGGEICH